MSLEILSRHETHMQGLAVAWCFGGGWACDLWAGRESRLHHDVDVVIWRQDHLAFRSSFADWQWQAFRDGKPLAWEQGECLELPVHNAIGRRGGDELEVLMIEREGEDWWYRRNPLVRMDASHVMLVSPLGLPVLNPAIALLFKSKSMADKDQHDFETVLPMMRREDRGWLKLALQTAHPQHSWIARL